MNIPSRSSRNTIAAAALAEFAEHGFAGARVARIAERARLNKQLVFYYFESKAQLYVDHFKSERDASRSARQEARAEETLSVARSAIRISKQHLIIAIIAIIAVITIAIFT